MSTRFILVLILVCLSQGCSALKETLRGEEHSRAREHDRSGRKVEAVQIPHGATSNMLANLRVQHPRLLMTQQDFARTRGLIGGRDELATSWMKKLLSRAEQELNASPPRYRAPLLTVSRTSFSRIIHLAAMYQLTNDARFARAAREELLAVCEFPDWNPQDFLSVGEMTAAVAIGYDWIYNHLSEIDRATIRRAIVEKGLTPGLRGYQRESDWTVTTSNWNFVCNGGMVLGALAIADDDSKLAEQVLAQAARSMTRALPSFAPDGGWGEGPSYWNYATRYLVYALSAMETACGSEANLSSARGLDRTRMFRIYMQGPTGKLFNFGDCDEHTGACPQMFWLARRFKQPAYAAFECIEERDEPTMLDLLWYQAGDNNESAVGQLPTTEVFRGVDVVAMRSAWNDPSATYVAIKGAPHDAHHAHLDAGSFVLDALGERWAIDLGAENYNLPGYSDIDNKRWTFYRAMTIGHNTITIDGQNQDSGGVATVIGVNQDPRDPLAVTDLSEAYRHKPHIWRGVRLVGGVNVFLQDEVQVDDGRQIIWSMHTRATIEIDRANGAIATLEQNGKWMRVEILEPSEACFEVAPATAPPPQTQQPDVRKLLIRLPRANRPTTIAVLFKPLTETFALQSRESPQTVASPGARSGPPSRAPEIQPLKQWLKHADR